jgi:hypothetical protein
MGWKRIAQYSSKAKAKSAESALKSRALSGTTTKITERTIQGRFDKKKKKFFRTGTGKITIWTLWAK